MNQFKELKISADLLSVVKELGYTEMTPIQAQAIPALLKGKDLIGQSKTGSGKTAAFTLPILERIEVDQSRRTRNIQALMICPTRELCTQVLREVRKLGRRKIGLQVLELAGGSPVGPQARLLENGVHICVGTPGRILDHLERGNLDLTSLKSLVLDEADRMLEMGFKEEMETIMAALPEERQTILFSATFPQGIQKIAARFMKDPVSVKIETNFADETEDQEALSKITQLFYQVTTPEEKSEALLQILTKECPDSAIIFCNMKADSFAVNRELKKHGVSSEVLNGDLEQRERDLVMAKFRNESIRILVATDVAARGIDVSDLDLVVNYDLPQKPDIYVHRIGRTGRAGKNGKAISLIFEREKNKPAVANALAAGSEVVPFQKGAPAKPKLESKMETLLLFEGRKNKMRPGDILGALTGEAGGLQATDIGKIEIHDFYSYVAVAKKVARVALERLQNGRIKGRKVRVEFPR